MAGDGNTFRSVGLIEVLEGHADVWRIDLDPVSSALSRCWADLSGDERERATQFARPEIRCRFVAARSGLRRILSRYTSRSPRSIEIIVSGHGKPALPAGPQFNLSHSGDLALCVVTKASAVGVDLERIRPIAEADELARRWLGPEVHPAPCVELDAPPGRAFLRRWTMREAYLKALGIGVGGLPAGGAIDRRRWSVHELRPAEGYVAAVVVERERFVPRGSTSEVLPR